ncbi:MAG: hypothetical protein ACOX2U_07025 [Limisphaerales bacterium]|jgi:hypothetical protein|nr:hypothetical protein [Verrucomicrobiota bacterium]
MSTKLSDLLGVSPEVLEKGGVFNALVNRDSLVYVDPHALLTAKTPELQQANLRFRRYVSGLIRLLQVSSRSDDVFYAEVLNELQMGDMGIHYSHAISRGLAGMKSDMGAMVTATARKFVRAGITDTELFPLVAVLEGVEMKRAGGMVAKVILPNLFAYTDRVVQEQGIANGLYRYMGKTYCVPFHPLDTKPIIFMPAELLSLRPVAYNWSESDIISKDNDMVKMMVTSQLGDNWKTAFETCFPSLVKKVMLLHPSLMVDLIRHYRSKPSNSVSASLVV